MLNGSDSEWEICPAQACKRTGTRMKKKYLAALIDYYNSAIAANIQYFLIPCTVTEKISCTVTEIEKIINFAIEKEPI
jgi:hypothetical protein